MKKIITIVGARPQIIKASALSRAVRMEFSSELEEIIVHTGQHYDENMSNVFFDEMQIPQPKYNLETGSGSHGAQTAKMLEGLEKIFLEEKPDAVVVYGDTNSTIAGALAASKIHIPVVHIEAGLRSFNKAMPEEINRIACDHMSTLLFTPTITGIENLEREGFELREGGKATIDQPKVYHCGDVMYDNSLYFQEQSRLKSKILEELKVAGKEFVLCTVHRDGNTDIPENLESIFSALLSIAEKWKLQMVLPLHPRTRKKMEDGINTELQQRVQQSPWIQIIPPVGFLDVIALESNARMVITDSGGLQKEAYFFKKPCIILREQTEWIEIVENGNAILTGANRSKIEEAFDVLYRTRDFSYPPFYGDGKAASFICSRLVEDL